MLGCRSTTNINRVEQEVAEQEVGGGGKYGA